MANLKLKLGYDLKNSDTLKKFLEKSPKLKFTTAKNELGGYIFEITFPTTDDIYAFGWGWREETLKNCILK